MAESAICHADAPSTVATGDQFADEGDQLAIIAPQRPAEAVQGLYADHQRCGGAARPEAPLPASYAPKSKKARIQP